MCKFFTTNILSTLHYFYDEQLSDEDVTAHATKILLPPGAGIHCMIYTFDVNSKLKITKRMLDRINNYFKKYFATSKLNRTAYSAVTLK